MYLPNSTKAAEFLCHEEVMQTLAYAQENKNNLPLIQEILAKARLQKGLTHREASVLLACPSETVWEELYQLAEAIKLDYYGKRLGLFAPLQLLREQLCLLPVSCEKQAYLPEKTDTRGNQTRSHCVARYGTQTAGFGSWRRPPAQPH